MSSVSIHFDRLAVFQRAVEQLQRQRIHEIFLDRPPQWTRTVHWIVSFIRQERFRLGGQFERDMPICQPRLRALHLQVHNAIEIRRSQPVKDDNVVDEYDNTNTNEVTENIREDALEERRRCLDTLGNAGEFEEAIWCGEGSEVTIIGVKWELVEAIAEVEFRVPRLTGEMLK